METIRVYVDRTLVCEVVKLRSETVEEAVARVKASILVVGGK